MSYAVISPMFKELFEALPPKARGTMSFRDMRTLARIVDKYREEVVLLSIDDEKLQGASTPRDVPMDTPG